MQSSSYGSGTREHHVLTNEAETDFAALVERQSRFAFRVAYAVLLNRQDAEDAVQEIFLKLYRNGGWRNVANERAFLARVAWRLATDLRSRSAPTTLPWADVYAEGEPPSQRVGPEDTTLASRREALIHRLIDALPGELRVPLVLSAFDELNSREISIVLGVPEGTVRTRLQRARAMLRQKLATMEEARYA